MMKVEMRGREEEGEEKRVCSVILTTYQGCV
jgi:hypothetical protein